MEKLVCLFLVLRLFAAGYDVGEAVPVQSTEPLPPPVERSTVMFDAEGRQIFLEHKCHLVTLDEDSWGTAVPAAELAAYLGAKVTENENGATISYGGKELTLTVGKKQLGRDFAPFYRHGCLYAPMETMSDFFGLPMQVVDDFNWLLEDEPDYLVTHPHMHDVPSIVLGESKYTEDFFYQELYRLHYTLEEDNVAMVERHVAATVPYSVAELNNIASQYVRWPLDEYVYYNFINKEPTDNYFIPPELVATDGMHQLLLAMQRYNRELEGMVLAATGDADHLTLTIYMQLYSGFWDLPCLFDVDLTRQPESWLQKYNDEYRIAGYTPEVYKPEIGAWQITAVRNVRGYLNAQALLDHEPEFFE